MNNTGAKQQAQTVANALTGERGWKDVRFAITGDRHADIIAGFKAIINEFADLPEQRNTLEHRSNYKALLLTLEYVTAICRNKLETLDRAIAEEKERQDRLHQLQTLGAGNYPMLDNDWHTSTSEIAQLKAELKAELARRTATFKNDRPDMACAASNPYTQDSATSALLAALGKAP